MLRMRSTIEVLLLFCLGFSDALAHPRIGHHAARDLNIVGRLMSGHGKTNRLRLRHG